MSYLDRYLAGEREQVWDDLLNVGQAVFDEPLYEDAMAVARETMRRIRFNFELLILRLTRMGFIFGYDHLIAQMLTDLPYKATTWRDYLELRAWTYQQPPVFLPASLHEGVRDEIRAMGLADVEDDILDGIEAIPDLKANIARLEQEIGPLPMSLRAWYEQVGAVNLYGYYPGWLTYVQLPTHLMNYCDPLQVAVLDTALVDHLVHTQQQKRYRHFEFAADRNFKDNRAGSSTPYNIQWDEAGIDGRLLTSPYPDMTFVRYLRLCFHWAGFPGMAAWQMVPADDLAMLTEGLLPF